MPYKDDYTDTVVRAQRIARILRFQDRESELCQRKRDSTIVGAVLRDERISRGIQSRDIADYLASRWDISRGAAQEYVRGLEKGSLLYKPWSSRRKGGGNAMPPAQLYAVRVPTYFTVLGLSGSKYNDLLDCARYFQPGVEFVLLPNLGPYRENGVPSPNFNGRGDGSNRSRYLPKRNSLTIEQVPAEFNALLKRIQRENTALVEPGKLKDVTGVAAGEVVDDIE